MKTISMLFVTVAALSNIASADQLCGKLNGYCGNGWCNKTITPTYCLNGGNCDDGAAVKVISENKEALEQLSQLLDRGEGTRVCADGAKDEFGVFHVSSATIEEN